MADQEFETLDRTTLDEHTEAHETNEHNHHGISDSRSRFRDLRGQGAGCRHKRFSFEREC
jgi:hypothetical protein